MSGDDSGTDRTAGADDDRSVGTDADESVEPVDPADRSPEATVELGVELLAHAEDESLSLADAMDRIETITTRPALTREILDEAELRDVIEREEGRVRFQRGGTDVKFGSQVVRRDGDYDCRRCGASISTGHFVQFEAGELGPFGPECVRKVTGRESDE